MSEHNISLKSDGANAHAPRSVPVNRSKHKKMAEGTPAPPWGEAEDMGSFLADLPAETPWLIPGVLAPGNLTEVFAPRGLGKSLLADYWAVQLAKEGKHVLVLDRDNPRSTLRTRLRGFGADGLQSLRALSREKCPPLTKFHDWAAFPYGDYDAVIVDSFDSMAEGVGEQDSSKPARALAPLLDICHRDNGPAVLLLGNTIKTAAHSRGSGVVEDRADVVYEVRDATDFHPSGQKPWVEELGAQGADAWAQRSARRKHREIYRLAMVCTKFRLGEEPAPFVLEINTTDEPWIVRDVTADVDAAGEAERNRRSQTKAAQHAAAVDALRAEVQRRKLAGESELTWSAAEAFLTSRGHKRKVSRTAINDPVFEHFDSHGRGNPKAIRLAGTNTENGANPASEKTAEMPDQIDDDLRHPHQSCAAQKSTEETQEICNFAETAFCADNPSVAKGEGESGGSNGGIRDMPNCPDCGSFALYHRTDGTVECLTCRGA